MIRSLLLKFKIVRVANGGYVLLTTIVFMAIFLSVFAGYVNYMTLYSRAEHVTIADAQALAIAEAGADQAIYQLNQNSNYGGETNTSFGAGTFTTTVASVDSSTKRITSVGYVPNSANPISTRTVKVSVNIDTSVVSFRYGVQVGDGGVTMGNGSQINGNMYSDGPISGSGTITGDATVAIGSDATPDQQWSTRNSGFNIGDTSARADVAESFKPSVNATITKISLNLKKTGNPGDLTIKLMTDNSGKPSQTVLTTGTLPASQVTGSYGFSDVTLAGTTNLTSGTTYWIIAISSAIDASNYFTWGDDTGQGYVNGTGKYSTDWNAPTPVWNAANADMNFKTYMAGATSTLSGVRVQGNARANTLLNCTVNGDAYYQSISSCSVGGIQHPNSADPTPTPLPVSDAQIADWEATAAAGGITQGNYTIANGATVTLGPREINGDLTVSNNATLTLSGPVWVVGNVSFSNNATLKVAAGTGNAGAILLADATSSRDTKGTVDLSNNIIIAGNGNPGSYPMVLSTNTGANAISFSNNANSVILYAPYGTVTVNNGAATKAIVAYKLSMNNNSTVNYDSGLQNQSFSNGPGGSWVYIHGTYVIK